MPNETLLPATANSRLRLLQHTISSDILRFHRGRRRQLERAGIIVPEHTYIKWDDTYNKLVANGHNRTPLHIAFDLIYHLITENPAERFAWFYGDPKAGKTFLARLVAVHLCAILDVDGMFCNWASKLDEIRRSINGHINTDLTKETQAPVLILDDMGQERGTLWEIGMLYNLIENRSRSTLTLCTSNLALNSARTGLNGTEYAAYLDILGRPARLEDGIDGRLAMVASRIRSRLQTDRYLLTQLYIERKEP